MICGLARTQKGDIDAAWGAVKDAERPRIHTFISTSDIHIEHQLRTDRDDVRGQAKAAVAHARELCEDVEFSPMDATRADVEFTAEVCGIAIAEGAGVINIPDTVGYTTPDEYTAYLTRLYELLPELRGVRLSVHCHDDLGLAVANSFAGVQAGARQVECAVNGIGERAGNCSLEEIVMLLRTRRGDHGFDTGLETTELARTSRMVSRFTGYVIQPNKAIVGRNAFAHESGIHQDGVLKERTTFEIMDARDVGLDSNQIVLGKHSGRHALKDALEQLGFVVEGNALNTAFKRFKELADKKKQVTALDLEAIVSDEMREASQKYELAWFEVEAGTRRKPLARVGVTHAGRRGGRGRVERRRAGRLRLRRDPGRRRYPLRAQPVHGLGRRRGRRRARRGHRDAPRPRAPGERTGRRRRTSSRRRRRPTSGRSRTRSRARRCARPSRWWPTRPTSPRRSRPGLEEPRGDPPGFARPVSPGRRRGRGGMTLLLVPARARGRQLARKSLAARLAS